MAGENNSFSDNLTVTRNFKCNSIQYNIPSQPLNANYLGYSNMIILNTLYNMNYNVYNNIISITLPYAGAYHCDVSFPINCTPGWTADCIIQYCISTNSTTPDSAITNTIRSYVIGAGQQKH